tara:strand:- start:14355 stop:15581 length:1227 start_codon:yes stop_codon:yes gene_type:complete
LTATLPTSFTSSEQSSNTELQRFFSLIEQLMQEQQLIRLVLSKYQGPALQLRRLEISPVEIKSKICWRFVWQYQTNHQTQNYGAADALALLRTLLPEEFKAAQLQANASETQMTISKKGKVLLNSKKISTKQTADISHNREKQRFVEQSRPFLTALGVTDVQGRIIPAMANKWKQINKFIEILQAAVKDSGLLQATQLHVADFGSGKAYLTFAMHDYFCHTLGLTAKITGVELRQNLVDLCNNTVAKLNLSGIHFEQGDVKHFQTRGINVMVALHACDVATDYAINMGVRTGAEIIMCSPCCHKEIRPQIRLPDVMAPMLSHGIHLGQEAEMVTDSLRALLLEAHGYHTKVFEFISLEHTSKNKMILATKRKNAVVNSEALQQIASIKQFYGIKQQCLEQLLQGAFQK